MRVGDDSLRSSEKLQRMMDTPPSWIISKGIGVIILLFLLLALVAVLIPIRYLDGCTVIDWFRSF